ncbi:hypothetical protein AU468_06605 [Alkalispirochaeta sphaeroplastigenens]|uniref:Uncharacterized protein n=1 Tax=Alkalispirochaeta sphaeroplastigenens TaxID=1187066 RepID=A0A2S4JRV6_9SPIO|nr:MULTISPECIES: hypothetical protein [Alkalispirochaeta]POR02255.1 hypothetical protein AU468_06605 [Alkalispirochaeta sphaeroplastigenens]
MLDIFLYLRPESNGVLVESTILSVIQRCREYRQALKFIYLANFPGSYIVNNAIVERHYSLRLFFAVHGGRFFTPDMRRQFRDFYGEEFPEDRVLGAFAVLRRYRWSPERLFSLWVKNSAVVHIAGQVIKRHGDHYIVNYDMPALLHKNNASTDIAVMAFRTRLGYSHFFGIAHQMKQALIERGVLRKTSPIARTVHISRSPFEQLADTRDYLLTSDGSPATLEDSSFARFLLDRGVSIAELQGLLEHPVCTFNFGRGLPTDHHLFDLSEGFSYDDARRLLDRLHAQVLVPGYLR